MHTRTHHPVPLRAGEFNFEFERGYPEEMPRNVLQYYMYHLMLDLREEDRIARMQREGAQEGSGSRK